MGREKKTYPTEFRERMVALVRSGRTAEELGREFEPTAQTIRNWGTQADRDEGIREDGLKTAERAELHDLRREVKRLKQEQEILTKAAAWFARETDVLPKRGTSS